MGKGFKIIVAVADLHIGVKHVSPKDMRNQLKTHFFDVVSNMKYVDCIAILGDVLHTIVSLNSEYSELYLWFIGKVYKLAKKKQASVIIVRGTRSHDNDQLQNIRSYVTNDDGVDFRIYETIEETTLWDDYKVLVLPDVQVKKRNEIDQYLTGDKKYDLILGHGLVDRMKYFVQDSEAMPSHVYEYSVEKLVASCKGPIMFGHIHQYQSILDQFFYVGPFTLLERGGKDAGFVVCGIADQDHNKFHIDHYINPESASYYEIKITKKILEDTAIDDLMAAIDDVISGSKPNDLISLKITRGDELESSDKVAMLESRYRPDRRFSIVKKVKSKKEEESEQRNKERTEKFSYIMDDNMDLAEIFFKYYQDEVLPTMPDAMNPAAKLTLEQFREILKN